MSSQYYYYVACVCSQYNARSDWLILGHYNPVIPMGQFKALQNQRKNPYNKHLINLKHSVLKEKISNFGLTILTLVLFSQYSQVFVWRFSLADFNFS